MRFYGDEYKIIWDSLLILCLRYEAEVSGSPRSREYHMLGIWISFDTLDLIQNYLIESVHDWTRDIPIIEDLINPTPLFLA